VKPDDIFHVKLHVKFQVKYHVKFHVKKTEAELSGGVNQIFYPLRKSPVWLPFSGRITGWVRGCTKTS
tara:strand:- start:364 stop:567 length:204 start_codon:yes stop_codon:yes gene_type:complete